MTFWDVIGWLIIGLIAGWLASVVMGRGGYGIVGDIVVGIVGAFIGGLIARLLNIGGPAASELLHRVPQQARVGERAQDVRHR